ncbi:MAG TPA: hypothetical protein VNR87_14280 [Flavisolibacter sp.]|nr:hypothetical protein [Flavisolibacter sp.]
MKILWAVGLTLVVLWACNDSASINIHVDSAGNKLDTTAKRLLDTAKTELKRAGAEIVEKAKNLKVEVNTTTEHKRDSIKKN